MPFDRPALSQSPPTEYFTPLANVYASARPTYPRETIDAMLRGLPSPARAIDIGCGTGISTRLLAEAGAQVIGIDPSEGMLSTARSESSTSTGTRHLPAMDYRHGTAEHTGLPGACANLVLCAQAFHWFNAAAALQEFHRILVPGGRAALLWNIKTDANPFSAGFCKVAEEAMRDAATRGRIVPPERAADITIGGWFANPRTLNFTNDQRLDLSGVLARAHSASYYPTHEPLRSEFDRGLTDLFNQHQEHGFVTLSHRAELTLADRADCGCPT